MKADRTNNRSYFKCAVRRDVDHLQRLLKRSPRAFTNFVIYISEWFRKCPQLQQLWSEVWSAGTVGRPRLKKPTKAQRRSDRLTYLGFLPQVETPRNRKDVEELSRAIAATSHWSDEDEELRS